MTKKEVIIVVENIPRGFKGINDIKCENTELDVAIQKAKKESSHELNDGVIEPEFKNDVSSRQPDNDMDRLSLQLWLIAAIIAVLFCISRISGGK